MPHALTHIRWRGSNCQWHESSPTINTHTYIYLIVYGRVTSEYPQRAKKHREIPMSVMATPKKSINNNVSRTKRGNETYSTDRSEKTLFR